MTTKNVKVKMDYETFMDYFTDYTPIEVTRGSELDRYIEANAFYTITGFNTLANEPGFKYKRAFIISEYDADDIIKCTDKECIFNLEEYGFWVWIPHVRMNERFIDTELYVYTDNFTVGLINEHLANDYKLKAVEL